MNKLATHEIKTHVVVTFNKSKHLITEQQYQVFLKSGSNRRINIGSAIINTSTIAEIMELEEYYNQNKNERKTYNNYTNPEIPKPATYSKSRHQIRLKSMRDGFLKGVSDRNNLTEKQNCIFKNMELKLNEIENQKLLS